MKEWKQKNKRAEIQGLIKGKVYSTGITYPNSKLVNSFAGFPRVKGSWNNLWRWDSLEDVIW